MHPLQDTENVWSWYTAGNTAQFDEKSNDRLGSGSVAGGGVEDWV